MKAITTLACAILLAGCEVLPKPLLDDENGTRLSGITHRAHDIELTEEAIHEVFYAAYSRTRDPLMGGEDMEKIHLNLIVLRDRLGDNRFSIALAREAPAVISAIAWHFGTDLNVSRYPQTAELFSRNPACGFELEEAYKKEAQQAAPRNR